MPYIKAKMVNDNVELYAVHGGKIPRVLESDHPRFVKGTRLDWGFVQTALEDGWSIAIEPHEVNRSNCEHPEGFDRTGMQMGHGKIDYRLYWCPLCHASRGVIIKNEAEVVEHYPTDHAWDYAEDIL